MWRSSTEALHEQQIKQILEHQALQLQATSNNVTTTSNKDESRQGASPAAPLANDNAATSGKTSSAPQKPPPAPATTQNTNEKQSLEKKAVAGNETVIATATPPNTAAAKILPSTKTTAAVQSPAPQAATPSDLPPLSVRYTNVLETLLQQFPHLVRPPPTVVSFPPAIATSFSLYPSVSRQVMTLTARVHELENQLRIQSSNNTRNKTTPRNKKRGREDKEDIPTAAAAIIGDMTGTSPPTKKRKSRRKEGPISIKAPIKNRTDVPDDVKEFIDKLRSERRTAKKRLHRLEDKVNKQKDELEKRQSPAKAPLDEVPSVAARPAQAVGTGTAKTPPAAAAAAASKPKDPPPPSDQETVSAILRQYAKTMKPPPTWEGRIKELEHFKLGNAHCRVPLRVPGLGRWVGEIRSLYRKSLEDPLWLVSQEPKEGEVLGQYALTKDRIDQLDAMGFEWNLGKPSKTLEERIEQLKNFKEKHGHVRVPRSHKDDPSLGVRTY